MPSSFKFSKTASETTPTSVNDFLQQLPAEVKTVLTAPVDAAAIAKLKPDHLVLALRAIDRLPTPRMALYNAIGKALATHQQDQAETQANVALKATTPEKSAAPAK